MSHEMPTVRGPSHRPAWRRLLRAGSPRLTKANVLASALALALGFAIAVQVHQTSLQGLQNLRESDLVRLLDTVNKDNARLSEELTALEIQRDELDRSTNVDSARKAAQERLDSLGILAGTVPAKGPGIVLTVRDPQGKYTAAMLLDALQELRDAGTEAAQINSVRVTAATWFSDAGKGRITVDGTDLSAPYTIKAIGESRTLAAAMEIPGGVSESARRIGGDTTIVMSDSVNVTALRAVSTPRYARPVAQPSPSS